MYKIEFQGINELKDYMLEAEKLDDVKEITRKYSVQLGRLASILSPVDTGFLKRSMVVLIQDGGMTGIIEFYAEYAPYQEFGTRWMPGKWYLKRGFDQVVVLYIADLERLFGK